MKKNMAKKIVFTEEEKNKIIELYYHNYNSTQISKIFNCSPGVISKYLKQWLNIDKLRIGLDLVGKRFGRLVVVSLSEKRCSGEKMWNCLCDCGNTLLVSTGHLTSGHTRSCGCLARELAKQRNFNDLTGKIFGNLKVIKEDSSNEKRGVYWYCECLNCGNIISVRSTALTSGNTKSCGCIASYGEKSIAEILIDNNIIFKKQYTFTELKGLNGGLLRFDFGILDKDKKLKYLIEFDGRQHTDTSKPYYSEKIVIHDKRKNDYCIKNNIKLIRIPYTKMTSIKIEDLKLETSQYVIN